MRSTAPEATGMHIAIPSSGVNDAGIGHAVSPASARDITNLLVTTLASGLAARTL
jgi:hypothetical protein